MQINQSLLRAAQSKAAIARFLGDGNMWMQAHEQIKSAIGMPWHKRGSVPVCC